MKSDKNLSGMAVWKFTETQKNGNPKNRIPDCGNDEIWVSVFVAICRITASDGMACRCTRGCDCLDVVERDKLFLGI